MAEYIIDEDYDNVRVDKFLRKKYKDIPLMGIYKMIRKGRVKVNGKKTKEKYRLLEGDILKVITNDIVKEKKFIKLDERDSKLVTQGIVYEDENILLFNKPYGIVVHKGSGHDYGLIEILKSYYKNSDINFVNRIDKMTSGLILAGKNLKTIRTYTEYIRNKEIKKYYYVLVKGEIKEKKFVIESNLLKGEKNVNEVAEDKEGKWSKTIFKAIKVNNGYSLLEAELVTGRTHQIRVQLAEKGYPILGDYKYGVKSGKKMFLFSHKIEIEKENFKFNLELPEYFSEKLF
ncbi:RluA family pseudouridine synthase [Haliovirga abyssi]|uniref:Pseudouridine synthase n=1 Tax=Haliovirga abyssi TaxID=2996794 RepID=A0AAU9D469_9FUSO|nr:RluA family pseudouridine synthase [Haliovirga abyssi]BDU50764.1 tRNA pseudouridine synthase A [Haliovirga abyssi]